MPIIKNKKTGRTEIVTHDQVKVIQANRMTRGLYTYENMEQPDEPAEVADLKAGRVPDRDKMPGKREKKIPLRVESKSVARSTKGSQKKNDGKVAKSNGE